MESIGHCRATWLCPRAMTALLNLVPDVKGLTSMMEVLTEGVCSPGRTPVVNPRVSHGNRQQC